MKTIFRLATLFSIIIGMHVMILCVQPVLHNGSNNGGQACVDDDTDVDTDEY